MNNNIEELNKLIENSRILANIKEEDIEWVPKVGDIIVFIKEIPKGFNRTTELTKIEGIQYWMKTNDLKPPNEKFYNRINFFKNVRRATEEERTNYKFWKTTL